MTETQLQTTVIEPLVGSETCSDGTANAAAAPAVPATPENAAELEPHLSHTAASLASPLVRMMFSWERLMARLEYHPTAKDEKLFVALEKVRALRNDQLRSHLALGEADQVDAVLFRRSIETSNRQLDTIISSYQDGERNALVEAEWTNAHRQALTRMAERHERLVDHIDAQLKLEGLMPSKHWTWQHGLPEPQSETNIGRNLHLKYVKDSWELGHCSEYLVLHSTTLDDGQLTIRLMQPDCRLRPAKRVNADSSWRTACAIVELEVMRALETKGFQMCMERMDIHPTPVFPYRSLDFHLRPIELVRTDVMEALSALPPESALMRKVEQARVVDLWRRFAGATNKQIRRFLSS